MPPAQQPMNAPLAAEELRTLTYITATHVSAGFLRSIALMRFHATCMKVTKIKHCWGEPGHEFQSCPSLKVPQLSVSDAQPFAVPCLIPTASRKRHTWNEINCKINSFTTRKAHSAEARFQATVHEGWRSRLLVWFTLPNRNLSWAIPKLQWWNIT